MKNEKHEFKDSYDEFQITMRVRMSPELIKDHGIDTAECLLAGGAREALEKNDFYVAVSTAKLACVMRPTTMSEALSILLNRGKKS